MKAALEEQQFGSPAYAGIGPEWHRVFFLGGWLPRVCGDRPVTQCFCDLLHLAPPRMRG